MNRPDKSRLRVFVILTVSALSAGCMTETPVTSSFAPKRLPFTQLRQQDPDITGSVSARAPSRTEPATTALRPPPTAVEIRAQCWMRYEDIAANLDTKTILTQQCIHERLRGMATN